ncbi:hypothetical protein BD626DRAFT_571251 [Schizophyllum amplum]|uniref:Uncharacterized protein n=1 Tax=Schizophyllum amplum TaxID=97359 RepID=A0A550C7U8_9AGAR|nr:hypothetical protein BD626DRAFT_571251 [Auriculariopsis ampla]
MDNSDSLPFTVLNIGGQTLAYMPGGNADIQRLIAFARLHPDIFENFFPNVNITDLVNGQYDTVVEPEETSDNDEGSVASSPPTDDSSTDSGSPGPVIVVDPPEEEERSYKLPRSEPVPAKLIFEYRAAQAVLDGRSLDFVQLVRHGRCILHDTYHDDFVQRAIKDRARLFAWDQRKAVPANPHELKGLAWRNFLRSQGLPLYVPPTRVRASFVPRQRSLMSSRPAGMQNVKGGTLLYDLTHEPSPLDLAYSTAGTLVVPEAGRIYTFDDLYPEATTSADWDMAVPSSDSSPARAGPSVWGSSSTVASPWPASQESTLSLDE